MYLFNVIDTDKAVYLLNDTNDNDTNIQSCSLRIIIGIEIQ